MKKILPEHTISLVLPCYNEMKRLHKTFEELDLFMKDRNNVEVVFVNDGSKDSTAWSLKEYAKGKDNVVVVDNKINKGKWGAIYDGVAQATGDLIVLMDVDLSVSTGFVDEAILIALLDKKNIVIGNRYVDGSSKVPMKRLIFSRGFNMLVRILIGLENNDTQCPMKVFWRESVSNEFMDLTEYRFCGDVDFIKGCLDNNKKIIEMAVTYKFEEGSQVSVIKHGKEMFLSLFRLRYKYRKVKSKDI